MSIQIEVKESVIEKMIEVHGIDLREVQAINEELKFVNVTFDAFNIPTGSLNYKLLAFQGINARYVKLQSLKKGNPDMIKVVMLRTTKQNDYEKIVSFYECYVEASSDDHAIGITPIKADNSNKKSKNRTSIVNLTGNNTSQKEPDNNSQLSEIAQALKFLTSEISGIKSEIDTLKSAKPKKLLGFTKE